MNMNLDFDVLRSFVEITLYVGNKLSTDDISSAREADLTVQKIKAYGRKVNDLDFVAMTSHTITKEYAKNFDSRYYRMTEALLKDLCDKVHNREIL